MGIILSIVMEVGQLSCSSGFLRRKLLIRSYEEGITHISAEYISFKIMISGNLKSV